MATKRSILIINPNTTTSMTDALRPLIASLGYASTSHTFFTAPHGVASINDEDDAAVSAEACLPALTDHVDERGNSELDKHDAFLVCCYSAHPLVSQLRARTAKLVAGIFEASVATCLQVEGGRFGIVSTGRQWEGILDAAVSDLFGIDGGERVPRYAGTETTGLNADELHSTPRELVDQRMKAATRRLLRKGNVKAICLGCAGMAGLDVVVRQACVEELGEEEGGRVRIVDGVVAGVNFLEGALRAGL